MEAEPAYGKHRDLFPVTVQERGFERPLAAKDLIAEGKVLWSEWRDSRIRSRKKQRLICWFGKR